MLSRRNAHHYRQGKSERVRPAPLSRNAGCGECRSKKSTYEALFFLRCVQESSGIWCGRTRGSTEMCSILACYDPDGASRRFSTNCPHPVSKTKVSFETPFLKNPSSLCSFAAEVFDFSAPKSLTLLTISSI